MNDLYLSIPRYLYADLRRDLSADIRACVLGASAFQSIHISTLRKLSVLLSPPMLCSFLYRLSHWYWCHGWVSIAHLLAAGNRLLCRADIHPASHIGGGLYIPHTAGIVFVGHAGKKLSLLAHAAVIDGSRHPHAWSGGESAPHLGDEVSVGTFVVVHGAVSIGDRVSIGQGATVLRDVPADSIVVGAARTRLINTTLKEGA